MYVLWRLKNLVTPVCHIPLTPLLRYNNVHIHVAPAFIFDLWWPYNCKKNMADEVLDVYITKALIAYSCTNQCSLRWAKIYWHESVTKKHISVYVKKSCYPHLAKVPYSIHYLTRHLTALTPNVSKPPSMDWEPFDRFVYCCLSPSQSKTIMFTPILTSSYDKTT